MAIKMNYLVLAAMVGLGIASLSIPAQAQILNDEADVALEPSNGSKYELLDINDKGHDIGTLADKMDPSTKERIGDRDPDSTYLLQELDSENELAKK